MASENVKKLRELEKKLISEQLEKYNKVVVVKEATATSKAVKKVIPKTTKELLTQELQRTGLALDEDGQIR